MSRDLERRRQIELWVCWMRLIASPHLREVRTGEHRGRSKPGAGVGLFIARPIAEAHGGSLDVQSEAGSGSAFTFRLPVG